MVKMEDYDLTQKRRENVLRCDSWALRSKNPRPLSPRAYARVQIPALEERAVVRSISRLQRCSIAAALNRQACPACTTEAHGHK